MNDKSKDISQKVVADMENLTSPTGPLVQLVGEVKRSNSMALANHVRLRWALIAILFCLFVALAIVFSIQDATRNLEHLQAQQVQTASTLEKLSVFAKSTDDGVRDAQKSIEDAPRLVADENTGGLKIVATVHREDEVGPQPAPAIPVRARARTKKKAGRMVVKEEESSIQLFPADASLPHSIEIPVSLDPVETP